MKENTKVNSKSVLALVLGVLSIFISLIMAFGFITGVIGIVLGFLGLREIEFANQKGKTLATIGISFCVVGTLLPVVFMI